jgi:hypothetical protein
LKGVESDADRKIYHFPHVEDSFPSYHHFLAHGRGRESLGGRKHPYLKST